MPAIPLPVRNGLNPTRLRLPGDGGWPTVLEYLLARFPDDTARLLEKVSAAEVVDGEGRPVTATTAYRPHTFVFLYRDPPTEARVPFEVELLHRDENLLVVDKPHFLASTPRGRYVAESALVRLRRDLDLPELTPAHRLDRVTAGVLVFTVRPQARGAYQSLFDQRRVRKEYEAIAGYDPSITLPLTISSRIIKQRGTIQAEEVPGEPNAETRVELLEVRGERARYRLLPHTGKMHQLRVHLSSLGIPIVGDDFYPRLLDVAPDDYSNPLQLLARSLTFEDPYSGESRTFTSRRRLTGWH
ncbi:pseudouridine synthase [Rhodococcus tukisamuensis]|uniref:RNA pseudouridylate synthase n=1 Tax=Rhodococcus tukisamuensis TaxID=168276 RepID=A0A1G6P185_9NOCA|nr:pseudouridine synthase [Rhodococcus tukisamuensis]SDC73748.1 tRNA pseudouridine32 synthase / 23S rRNA pseudouridine746 synthase [Rhodococcus tukisamuensis]